MRLFEGRIHDIEDLKEEYEEEEENESKVLQQRNQ